MLKAIILRDFFSFHGENEVKLQKGVNLLLGINGSGKTSFINALRLLSEGVSGNLQKLIQEQWGGYNQIVNVNGERTAPYAQVTYIFNPDELNKINPAANFRSKVYYRITINQSGTNYTISEKMFTTHKSKDGNFTYLDFSNGKGRISMRTSEGKVAFQEYSGNDISGQELVIHQINDPQRYLPINTLRKAIESISTYAEFDVGGRSRLRMPTEFTTGNRLLKSGENLTQILNLLKLEHSFDFTRLENTFRNINPYFKSIEITSLYGGQSYLSLCENNMSRAIGALHISDGTLLFLLLECIFYNPLRGKLVAIDEPERGLHPDMIRSVAEMIKWAAQESQLIVATHSPHLLNQFELEDILIFEKDENNATIVKQTSEDDYPDWEGEYLPGQMWLYGKIGGKRW
jgi:predicted ATPase